MPSQVAASDQVAERLRQEHQLRNSVQGATQTAEVGGRDETEGEKQLETTKKVKSIDSNSVGSPRDTSQTIVDGKQLEDEMASRRRRWNRRLRLFFCCTGSKSKKVSRALGFTEPAKRMASNRSI